MSHRILAIEGEVNLQTLYYSKVLYKKYRKHIKNLKESSNKSRLMSMPVECSNFNINFNVEDFTFDVYVSENSTVKIPTQITDYNIYKTSLENTIQKANSFLENDKYSLNKTLFTEIRSLNEEIESNIPKNELNFSKFEKMYNSDRSILIENNMNEILSFFKKPLLASKVHGTLKSIAASSFKLYALSSAFTALGLGTDTNTYYTIAALYGVSLAAKKVKDGKYFNNKTINKTMKAFSIPAEIGTRVYSFIQGNNKIAETFMSVMKTLRSFVFKVPFTNEKTNFAKFIADGIIDSDNLTANISGRNKIDLTTVKFRDYDLNDVKTILKRLGYDSDQISEKEAKAFIDNPTLSSLIFSLIPKLNLNQNEKTPANRNISKEKKQELENKLKVALEDTYAFKFQNFLYVKKELSRSDYIYNRLKSIDLIGKYFFDDFSCRLEKNGSLHEKFIDILGSNFNDIDKNEDILIFLYADDQITICYTDTESEDRYVSLNDISDLSFGKIDYLKIETFYEEDFIRIPEYFNVKESSDFVDTLGKDDYIDLTEPMMIFKDHVAENQKSADDVRTDDSRSSENALKKATKDYIGALKTFQDAIKGKGSFYYAIDYLLEKSPSKELGIDQILSTLLIESFDVYGAEGMNDIIEGTAESLGFVNGLVSVMNDSESISEIVNGNRIKVLELAKEVFKQSSKDYFIGNIDLNNLANNLFNSNSKVEAVIEKFVESLYENNNRKPVTKLGKDLENSIFNYLKKLLPDNNAFESDEDFFDFIRNTASESQVLDKLLDSAGFFKNIGFNLERGLMTTAFEKTFGKKALSRVRDIYDTIESNQKYAMKSGNFPDQTTTGPIFNMLKAIRKNFGPLVSCVLISSQLIGTGASVVVGAEELSQQTKTEVSARIESETAELELANTAQIKSLNINKAAISKTQNYFTDLIIDNFVRTINIKSSDESKQLLKELVAISSEGLEGSVEERKVLYKKFLAKFRSLLLNKNINSDNDDLTDDLALQYINENFEPFFLAVNLLKTYGDNANDSNIRAILRKLYIDFHTRVYENKDTDTVANNSFLKPVSKNIQAYVDENNGDVQKGIAEYTDFCLSSEGNEATKSIAGKLDKLQNENNELLSILKDTVEEAKRVILSDAKELSDAEDDEPEAIKRDEIKYKGPVSYQARLKKFLDSEEGKEKSVGQKAYDFANLEFIFGESQGNPLKELYGYSAEDASKLKDVYKESKWFSSIFDRTIMIFKKSVKASLKRALHSQVAFGSLGIDAVYAAVEDDIELDTLKELKSIASAPVREFKSHAVDSFYGNSFITILSFVITALIGLLVSRNKAFAKVELIKYMSNAVNFGTAHYESILIRKFLISAAENAANYSLTVGEKISGSGNNRIVNKDIKILKECRDNLQNVVISADYSLSVKDVIENIRAGKRKKSKA